MYRAFMIILATALSVAVWFATEISSYMLGFSNPKPEGFATVVRSWSLLIVVGVASGAAWPISYGVTGKEWANFWIRSLLMALVASNVVAIYIHQTVGINVNATVGIAICTFVPMTALAFVGHVLGSEARNQPKPPK